MKKGKCTNAKKLLSLEYSEYFYVYKNTHNILQN